MKTSHAHAFQVAQSLKVGDRSYTIASLKKAQQQGLSQIGKLPFSLRILVENLLRHQDGSSYMYEGLIALNNWIQKRASEQEVSFRPARVLMQDFTGVPAVVDLAAMREAMHRLGGDEGKINPLSQVDLIIDHSVTVDAYGTSKAFAENVKLEVQRNKERYALLCWAQKAFDNFRVVPPGTGICHQVNLEFLGQVVWVQEKEGKAWAYPDTLVGTDSHTTMINGLGVLGWGVGGIEAEAAMLNQPLSMLIPEVVGIRIKGSLHEGVTATDLVLTVTELLRRTKVVAKFVEFFGPGLDHLSLPDRATIGNMSPEYGATCCYFPIDRETINYLRFTGRDPERIALVEAYAQEQGLWRDNKTPEPLFTQVVELDLASIEPTLAGPTRPQDKVLLKESAATFEKAMLTHFKEGAAEKSTGKVDLDKKAVVPGKPYTIGHGSVVIAAITSCTNTSNPSVMIGAGLLARKARQKGLSTQPWVKTSLAPGSKVVTDYYVKTGLQEDLDALGFNLVGYGCTTCIGNSGPLLEPISEAIHRDNLVVCSLLSGNRNFEGRIHPEVKANFLASPPLVVAYALAGTMWIDFAKDPLGFDPQGKPVFLKDVWPSNAEIQQLVRESITSAMFNKHYSDVFKGDKNWESLAGAATPRRYHWDKKSTYVKHPPYLEQMSLKPEPIKDIKGAYILAMLGDSITTDHISPAGAIKKDGPAAKYLLDHHVPVEDFNSYGARRGNYEVMVRGTFGNVRLRNEIVPGVEGGMTKYIPGGQIISIFEAASLYQADRHPLIVIAGKEYGSGSSRDWAAKGVMLLGVKAIIAESFERIHRSNLVGMGVLPLQFQEGTTRKTLGLTGAEKLDILGLQGQIKPKMEVELVIHRYDGSQERLPLQACINTKDEVDYYQQGGILPHVVRKLL